MERGIRTTAFVIFVAFCGNRTVGSPFRFLPQKGTKETKAEGSGASVERRNAGQYVGGPLAVGLRVIDLDPLEEMEFVAALLGVVSTRQPCPNLTARIPYRIVRGVSAQAAVQINASMSTVQEIERAIEALPLADRLRIYRDLPQLIGRDMEDLEWQRLGLERFFEDDSPDDAAYDRL